MISYLRRRVRTLAVAATVVAVLAASGCSGGGGGATGPQPAGNTTPAAASPEPATVDAARQLLDKAVGRATAGDHGGLYDLLVPEDQALIPRDAYIAYQEKCHADAAQGLPYDITDVRLEDEATAVGIVNSMGFKTVVKAHYRDGRWLTELTEENREQAQHWVLTGLCDDTETPA